MKNDIKIFEERKVRTVWDEVTEEWYFSIVDVVETLTNSPNPRKYWSVLKTRLKKEGSELTTICSQLKMPSADGKFYKTDVASTMQLFRLIQSIPSPKAEPLKLWIAKVAKERLDQIQDPELSIEQNFPPNAFPKRPIPIRSRNIRRLQDKAAKLHEMPVSNWKQKQERKLSHR